MDPLKRVEDKIDDLAHKLHRADQKLDILYAVLGKLEQKIDQANEERVHDRRSMYEIMHGYRSPYELLSRYRPYDLLSYRRRESNVPDAPKQDFTPEEKQLLTDWGMPDGAYAITPSGVNHPKFRELDTCVQAYLAPDAVREAHRDELAALLTEMEKLPLLIPEQMPLRGLRRLVDNELTKPSIPDWDRALLRRILQAITLIMIWRRDFLAFSSGANAPSSG